MKTNATIRAEPVVTYEGSRGSKGSTLQQLERAVLSCLLWERQFYEDGVEIADRIEALVAAHAKTVTGFHDIGSLAGRARNEFHLRHVPLLLICAMAEARPSIPWVFGARASAIEFAVTNCILRADELAELVALWWRKGRRPIPAAMKRGLAAAFTKFNAHQLAKYNRDSVVRLRDVMFLVHPRPIDEEQARVFAALANGTLPAPDTWEVALSGGADKKETFERLISEGRIGYLALLRNLRNMAQAGCDPVLVQQAIRARAGADRVLPFRYVAAARSVPQWEEAVDDALVAAVQGSPALRGSTAVLVDVSGSMRVGLSGKSDLSRLDAAAALASVLNCESLRVFTFTDRVVEVPPRRGMAGVDAVVKSQESGGTLLGAAVSEVNRTLGSGLDRIIVITDEQTADIVPAPVAKRAYMINVSSYQNGIARGRWTKINGFSEAVVRFIAACEKSDA